MTAAPTHDAEAIEYVLGLSTGEERRDTELALLNDPDLAREVWQLEEALAGLAEAPPTRKPPKHVWRNVERAAFGEPAKPQKGGNAATAFWRGAASLFGLAAVAGFALVAVLVWRPEALIDQPAPFVAAIVAEDGAVTLVRIGDDGTLFAEPFSGALETGRDPELWVVESGADPVSVGLLGKDNPTAIPLSGYDLNGARLVVTSEPEGGSPTEGPTGPAIATGELKKI